MIERRAFLKNTALTLATPSFLPLLQQSSDRNISAPGKSNLQMGMAGYTFLNYSIDQSIAIMQRVGINNLSIKDFHLPLDSTLEKIADVTGKFKAANINIYAVGVIYMKSEAEVDRAFEYAKKVGVNLIVGVPNFELVSYTEKKVKETNIRIAIHNHGPEDKLYPGPKDVYDRIKTLDSRVGMCLDIGHATRAGAEPSKAVADFAPRIFDMHIKDVSAAEKDGKAIEVGRGVINFPALIRTLYKIKYSGKCSIEFEKDMKDSFAGIAESTGYFKGVADTLA